MKLNLILLSAVAFAGKKGGSDKIQTCNNQIEQAKDYESRVNKLKIEGLKLSNEMKNLDQVCCRYKEVNADEHEQYTGIVSGVARVLFYITQSDEDLKDVPLMSLLMG